MVLNLVMIVKAEWRMRKRRAVLGKALSQNVRFVRKHDGSDGCSVAQESELMSGCACDVSGEIVARVTGKTSSLLGNSVGEMYGLLKYQSKYNRLMSERWVRTAISF